MRTRVTPSFETHLPRRRFLGLLAGGAAISTLPPIFFPLVSADPPAQAIGELPSGLGLGINLDVDAAFEEMLDLALEVFDPDWYYNWWHMPARNRQGWLPLIWTHGWNGQPASPLDPEEFDQYCQMLRWAGIEPSRLAWILGNEPEFSGWPPQRALQAMMVQVSVMRRAGIEPTIIATGCGIKEPHLTYMREWCDVAWREGLTFTLAIHIYDWRPWRLDQLWARFCQWFDTTSLDQVLVTECGAGENRTMDEWLNVMPWFYELLNDHRVRALAPFSAYPCTRFGVAWPGFMDFAGHVNELGQQWLSVARSRAAEQPD